MARSTLQATPQKSDTTFTLAASVNYEPLCPAPCMKVSVAVSRADGWLERIVQHLALRWGS
jgi:hypothetical protein